MELILFGIAYSGMVGGFIKYFQASDKETVTKYDDKEEVKHLREEVERLQQRLEQLAIQAARRGYR
jgi:hypothetical protein